MLTKEKIKEINSKRKPTEGFTEEEIKMCSRRAKRVIWFNSMIAHIMIIL